MRFWFIDIECGRPVPPVVRWRAAAAESAAAVAAEGERREAAGELADADAPAADAETEAVSNLTMRCSQRRFT